MDYKPDDYYKSSNSINMREFIDGFREYVSSQVQNNQNVEGPVNSLYDLLGELMLPIVGFIDTKVVGERIFRHTSELEGKGISPILRYIRDHTKKVVGEGIFDETYARTDFVPSEPARIKPKRGRVKIPKTINKAYTPHGKVTAIGIGYFPP